MNINKSFQLAVGYYQTGKLYQSESLCRQIIRTQPNHVDALNLLGLVCYCLANYDCAIHYIKRALEFNPINAEAYTNLGNAFRDKGQPDQAITCYEKAINLKPHIAMPYNNMGCVLQEKGQLNDAISYYQKALKVDPFLSFAYNNMGAALQEKNQLDDAISYYQKAVKLNPNFADAYNNLGLVFQKKGQLDDSISYYQRAVKLNPKKADIYFDFGNVLKDKGKIDEAIICYQKAIQLNPDYVNAYFNLGNALQDKGKIDEAVICYQKATSVMKLSIAIIVKNEEKCLRDCLESVKDADEIVVVDTGSTDKTVEIAKEYTDKILYFEWIDDFSKARNFAKDCCTGDWILSVDADHIIETSIDNIKKVCAELEELGERVGLVKSQIHWREVLYKNDKDIEWVGAVHECLNVRAKVKTDVRRTCNYSENHYKDPDRNLRILLAGEKTTRTKFYLGKEYFEKKKYDEAIKWMEAYLKEGIWIPEIGEAYLVIAKANWFTNNGNEARKACLKAIRHNPDFKEALLLMSEMTYEPLKTHWKRLAGNATNQDVLFIRNN